MSDRLSVLAICVIGAVLTFTRVQYTEHQDWTPLQVTTWDAFGYYLYLPGIFIYEDVKEQAWVEAIDAEYDVVGGGDIYQLMALKDKATGTPNGRRVAKYLGGVAILQAPFFFLGHWAAGIIGHPQDGFSPPYQYAIAFGAIMYALFGLMLLRFVLLRYFNDRLTALTLLLLVLATNAIQYISVDGGQSHVYIFPLYALILYTTLRWHERPSPLWAILTGATIGLATIGRPTEAIMLFIPLLWDTHTKQAAKAKWALVKADQRHVLLAVIAGCIAVLPQLVYWKVVTGNWVFDVGSKWDFLLPHFRVLFGWEKGWFIYTPITLVFVAGLFFMRGRPWRKSVLVFSLLNIYIIIAWHDWRYGGSYSTRALMQSYPVWALPLAAALERILRTRWRWPALALCSYLLCVNLFQIKQYNNGVILFDGMNGPYYRAIYLDADPTEADRRLLE